MKLAMIGSYGHTNLVLDHIRHAPGVELVAVARYGPGDALPFVGHHLATPATTPVFEDYRRMLDEVRPDIVSVNMPLHLNAQASIAAAQRGCHVFSEKPLAITLEDLAALRQAVAAAGTRITAMLEFRCHPAFAAVQTCVAAGRIGEPLLATAQKSYPYANRDALYARRETYGGTIPWIAIHAVDAIHFCTGKRFVRVAAMHGNGAHPQRPGMEDSGGILFELDGRGQAMVNFDYLRPWGKHNLPWGDDRIRIAGSEATVETLDCGRSARLLTEQGFEDLALPPDQSLFGDFVAAIRENRECVVPAADAFYATEVCLRAREAADEKRIVDLSDVGR